MKRKFIIPLLCLLLFVWSCAKNNQAPKPVVTGNSGQNLLEHLKYNYDFSEFYNAMVKVHLDTLLTGPGPFTIVIPDNVAFQTAGISPDSLNNMDTAQLRLLLGYHILRGNITTGSVPQALDYVYTNIDSLPLYFSEPIPGINQHQNPALFPIVYVNGDQVVTKDITASNGVIQVLTTPLSYPVHSIKTFLLNNPNYSFFTTALQRFNLLNQLDSAGPMVVLALSNDDFGYWGIDLDSINRMDTFTYKKYLFGVSILPGKFFFNADLSNGPPETNPSGTAYYLTTSYVLSIYQGNFQVYPLDYGMQQQEYNYVGSWGDPLYILDPDHLALNGIVQGLDGGLLIYPDSAMVNP